MIVTCPSCKANYRVANEKVPAGGARMRCPKCSTEFLAQKPADEPPPASPSAPVLAAPARANPFAVGPEAPPANAVAPPPMPATAPPPAAAPPGLPPAVPRSVTGVFNGLNPEHAAALAPPELPSGAPVGAETERFRVPPPSAPATPTPRPPPSFSQTQKFPAVPASAPPSPAAPLPPLPSTAPPAELPNLRPPPPTGAGIAEPDPDDPFRETPGSSAAAEMEDAFGGMFGAAAAPQSAPNAAPPAPAASGLPEDLFGVPAPAAPPAPAAAPRPFSEQSLPPLVAPAGGAPFAAPLPPPAAPAAAAPPPAVPPGGDPFGGLSIPPGGDPFAAPSIPPTGAPAAAPAPPAPAPAALAPAAPAAPPRPAPKFDQKKDIRPAMPAGDQPGRQVASQLREEAAPSAGTFDALEFDADDLFGGDAPFGDLAPAPEEPVGAPPVEPAQRSGTADAGGDFDEPSRAALVAKEALGKVDEVARKTLPPWIGETAAWASLSVGGLVLVVGVILSAWSAHIVDLDEVLLPTLERSSSVRPPRSYTGLDEIVLPELEQRARARRSRRDWGLEAVAWRSVLQRDPEHEAAKARITKLLRLLGDARDVAAFTK